MKRDPTALTAQEFDILIVGGGITGACIARDAAMRGLTVALVERQDFSCGTSSGSSKLVHGGLRYLRNMELGLVRESLAERRIWQRIAPHQVRPLPFLLPADQSGRRTLNLGLTLYDWLSFDRNWLRDPDQHMAAHKWLAPDAARAAEPVLADQSMDGAFHYFDCQMRSPERLGLECIMDAVRFGAVAVNYAEATGFLREGDRMLGATVRDTLSNQSYEVRASVTINAAGPWADQLLGLAQEGDPSRQLQRSKGIHLITRPLTQSHAVTVTIPKAQGGGHLFLLPWRGQTIIGTTDTPYDEDPDRLTVSEDEIVDYLALINTAVPGARLARTDVAHAYAGLRPLIQDKGDGAGTYSTSRKSEVVDHGSADGLHGFYSVIGGKWTTSRRVAEKTVDKIGLRLERTLAPCVTDVKPLPGGLFDALETFLETARGPFRDLPQANFTELALTYGSALDPLAALMDDEPALAEPVAPNRPELGAQILHAATSEMAETLDDVVFRRTGLGTLGNPGEVALARAGQIMAAAKGWDLPRTTAEIEQVRSRFTA